MDTTYVLVLAFLVGVVAGLRSLTAPAVVSIAACRGWLNLHNTSLAFLGSTVAAVIFALLAIVELVRDKLPNIPSRLEAQGLIARIVMGGLSGAGMAVAGAQSPWAGAALGAAGGIAGAFAGYQVRSRLVKALKCPAWVVAILEDAVAIGAGFWIVTRF